MAIGHPMPMAMTKTREEESINMAIETRHTFTKPDVGLRALLFARLVAGVSVTEKLGVSKEMLPLRG